MTLKVRKKWFLYVALFFPERYKWQEMQWEDLELPTGKLQGTLDCWSHGYPSTYRYQSELESNYFHPGHYSLIF